MRSQHSPGGRARAEKLSPEERSLQARRAANARWGHEERGDRPQQPKLSRAAFIEKLAGMNLPKSGEEDLTRVTLDWIIRQAREFVEKGKGKQ